MITRTEFIPSLANRPMRAKPAAIEVKPPIKIVLNLRCRETNGLITDATSCAKVIIQFPILGEIPPSGDFFNTD